MTKQDVVDAAQIIIEQMRKEPGIVPRDTGNLADNAITTEFTEDGIHISINLNIAPYAPYTNEPWVSAYWHGKKNPNEGWWERFAEEFTKRLTVMLKGEMK